MKSTDLVRLRVVAGKQTTRLTHYGRKTGNLHEVTIWSFSTTTGSTIGTANVNRQWVTAIRRKYLMFCPIVELGRLLAALGVMRDNTGLFEVTLAG